MVPVEKPKTNEKFASRKKIRKWKTGIKVDSIMSINSIFAAISELSRSEVDLDRRNTLVTLFT
jgi:hypothetical protein